MPRSDHDPKDDLIARTATEAERRLDAGQAAEFADFVRAYLEFVPARDLLGETPESLFGAILSHWKFATRRRPGEARVRVFNPSLEEHGWKSDFTVVEVVTDDMRFLVESVTAELNRQELTVHLTVHPVIIARRDADGGWAGLAGDGDRGEGVVAESYMHFRVTEQSGDRLAEIEDRIRAVLADVRAAVADYEPIRRQMAETIATLDGRAGLPVAPEDLSEVRDFLQWLHDDNFTFLGYRRFEVSGSKDRPRVQVVADSGLGILHDPDRVVFDELRDLGAMPSPVRRLVTEPGLLLVAKTNAVSTVRRSVFMDAFLVKQTDGKGKVVGLELFIGLFTATAFNQSVLDIPLLRHKVRTTLKRAGFRPDSHDGKVLLNLLETFPREELFQVSDDHLLQTSLGIKHLQERQRVALFVRRDNFERFMSCLVYVPRDHFTTDLRRRMQEILEQAFDGETLIYYTLLGDSPLARLHVLVRTSPGNIPDYDAAEIEARLADAARSWTDILQEALIAAEGEEKGLALARRYRRAFGSAYRERFSPEMAVKDIANVETVLATNDLGMNLYHPVEAADYQIRFKVYQPNTAIPLSDVLPMLEHMGLKVMDEIPFRVRPEDGDTGPGMVMIHDFGLETRDCQPVDLGAVRANFQDAFRRIWRGDVENDGFNALVLAAGLTWRQTGLLRAYAKYLRQAGIAFSQAYMEQTLAANPRLAACIVGLFEVLFDPDGDGEEDARAGSLREEIHDGLEDVASADEDRILRRFLNLVDATLRTNFFQTAEDGGPKPYVAVKLDSGRIEELPLPRPWVEIFVCSPRVEGIHLRFGKVARGGLRWSDRREDYRTEVLGLVKAQVVKNAVIVPVGSKGGFVVKRPPPPGDREALQAEGIACYKTFVRGMLDLTDNLDGDVVPPPRVVRRDDADSYLVVAADKGTATFSDIANGVAAEYGFWLGDAFASGGSHGYDHKEMGITARGAWESVKRHFRELGTDIQHHDFTVVGCGDMSGDVFGNGMLLSKHTRLVGAFNHQHIFVDPDPDPASSFEERRRLFGMDRSTWADYDRDLLSKGGGIFERRAKSIRVTPEIKKLFALKKDEMTPAELIRAMLKANVDLLWFGGIGTYVKASDETDAEVGDRSNDSLRVNAAELRARVIGEGANLGVTQRARTEFALAGGRANADFIDNSGGVNCSDHEVNIKILVDQVVANGDMTVKQRNSLLQKMTDEVAELVLRDSYLQTQAISVVQAQGVMMLDDQARLMRMLERAGRLNRSVEYLPDEETLTERNLAHQGLTRSEIAVLMSYGKIWLYDELLQSPLPDDPELVEDLIDYFPTAVRKKFRNDIKNHRLRREIIATRVTNSLINRVGGTFVNRLMENTGMTPGDIARAYTISRQVFGLREVWAAIEDLDTRVPAETQTAMLLLVNELVERTTLWFLHHGARPLEIKRHVDEFRDGIRALADNLDEVLPEHYREDRAERAAPYMERGVPEDLALQVAGLVNMISGCDIVRLAGERNLAVLDVARLYFAVGTRFRLGNLRASAEKLKADTHWQKLAIAALIEEIYGHQCALTAQVLGCSDNATDPPKALKAWRESNRVAIERTEQLLNELWGTDLNDFSQIAVASRQLRALAEAPPSACEACD